MQKKNIALSQSRLKADCATQIETIKMSSSREQTKVQPYAIIATVDCTLGAYSKIFIKKNFFGMNEDGKKTEKSLMQMFGQTVVMPPPPSPSNKKKLLCAREKKNWLYCGINGQHSHNLTL